MKNKKNPALFAILLALLFTCTLTSSTSVGGSFPRAAHSLDAKALQTAETVGGGAYNREMDAILPFFPSLLEDAWSSHKKVISKRIGPIENHHQLLLKNSANTIEELIDDAKKASPEFIRMLSEISLKTGGVVNFGIENKHMIKNKESIQINVLKSMNAGLAFEDAVKNIRDCLRGTIITESPEQICVIIKSLNDYANRNGREWQFINHWELNHPDGYVGIHAKMLFPIMEDDLYTHRDITIEVQIHLKCIMDGNKQCIKEKSHKLYYQMLRDKLDQKIQSPASMLLYLTGIKEAELN